MRQETTEPQTPSGNASRKVSFILLLILGGCLLGVLLMELGTRVLGIKPERFERPGWQVLYQGIFHDSNIWGNGLIKQNSRFQQYGIQMGEYVTGTVFKCIYPSNPRGYFDANNGVVMSVDRWGMRRREHETQQTPSADTHRVLLLGDSFTFGVGVRDEDTFARGLEQKLNGSSSEKRVEVLNAAVQGYNTRDEVICLEGQWLAFEPELVLIVFYVNDAYNDSTILNNGEALGVYLQQPEGWARRSRLWDLLQHKQQARKTSRAVEDFYKQQYFSKAGEFLEQPGQMQVDWTDCKKAFARAAELSRQHGFKLGVVIFPELYYLDDRHPFLDIYKLVRETCEAQGIPVLDLYETTFRGKKPRELWVHPADHHPNEVAHRLTAEAIAEFIARQALLP